MKKTFFKIQAIISIILILSIIACSNKVDENEIGEISLISDSPITMGYDGGDSDVKFTCNTQWNISSDVSWITFKTPAEGDGNAIVTTQILANDTKEIRSGKITISANATIEVIDVTQEAKTLIKFKHPSILYTEDELLQIKEIISNNSSSSVRTTFDNLINRCNSALTYITTPYTGNSSYDFIMACATPGALSRDLAFAYWLTDDKRYADKSISIIKAWATKCSGIKYVPEGENGMYLSRGMFMMMTAYDMLLPKDVIDSDTKELMINWFKTLKPEVLASIKSWEDNDYFDKQYYQNHLVAHSMGLMMLGFATDDESLVQLALDSPENPRDLYECIAGCIFMKGDAPCSRENPNAALPETGEIYDRYRHKTAPLKGLQYSHLTQTLMATMARMCHNNGIDMFSYTAPTGENLRFPFEYYSDYYRLMDSCIKSSFYCGEDSRIGKAEDNPGMFELGLRYYTDSEPIKNLIYSNAFNRETAYMNLLGYTRFFSAIVDK